MGEKINKYFDARADHYLEKSDSGLWRIFRLKERDSIARLLNAKAQSSLLDLGSGAGYYSIYFKEHYMLDVFAIDTSAKMVNELKKRGVPCQQASVETMDLFKVFDNALAAGVLEFVDRPEVFFKLIGPMIRPGGRLVLLVPAAGLFGLGYKLLHGIGGCPANIRSSHEYENLAAMFGFKKIGTEKPTLISRALCFEKIIENSET
ncbi:MAG: class I SAM-dependent methyltransferase [Bacteriovorax sp.]